MKSLVLVLMMVSGMAFAGESYTFKGEGSWKNTDESFGTWTNTFVYEILSAEGEALKVRVSDDLKLLVDGEIVNEMKNVKIWHHNYDENENKFRIYNEAGDQVGSGICRKFVNCLTFVKEEEMKVYERLKYSTETKVLNVVGRWYKGEEHGGWEGSLKLVEKK